jgi:hypothetical protein
MHRHVLGHRDSPIVYVDSREYLSLYRVDARDDMSLTPPRLMAWLRYGVRDSRQNPGGAGAAPPDPQRVRNLGKSGILAQGSWGETLGSAWVTKIPGPTPKTS